MPFGVDKETQQRTTRCRFDFQCLAEGSRPHCPVKRAIEGNGVFLETATKENCPYQIVFGHTHVCNCPVRCELYERSGV